MNPAEPTPEALLERAARRLATNDRFVAWALAAWCGGDLDLDRVRGALGCDHPTAVKLGLCLRPREDTRGFREDVTRIAAEVGIDAFRLMRFLRDAATLAALRGGDERGVLAAARDVDPEDT